MLTYTRYPNLDFTYFVSEGETTIENWLESLTEYAGEGMTTRELYDLRKQTNLFSTEGTGMIINRSMMVKHLHPPNGRTAVVVDDVVKYGIAEIYALQAKSHEELSEIKVFFTLGEAIGWLGNDVARCL